LSDYTDIQSELDDLENAVYGEEVRDSMVSAIKKIHDVAESAAGAPDASSATAGQAPIADGAGGWAWGDVATSGDSVPTEVRQAILALFQNGVYTRDDMSDEVAVVQSWVGIVVPVSGLTLNHNALNVYTGHTKTVTATITPINASDQTIQWSSSDLSVATISVSGKTATITGVANGSAIITATTRDGGYLGTCTVTVAEAIPESVTITGVEPSISSGTQFTVTAVVTPAEAPDKTLTWRSSNTSVATVTPSADTMSCTVSCIAEGTTTITATTNVGSISASFTIDVANGHLAPITPTLLNKAYTYAYVADTKAGIDTSDTSTIINFGNCRRYLVFDCRGMSKIRIEKYADDNLYMANLGVQAIYAFNSAPVAMNQVSPPSSSDTTQAAYKLVSSIASNTAGSLETYYKIDDYDIDQNYPYVVVVAPKNLTTGSSYTVAEDAVLSDFTKTTDTYTTVSHWCVRVSEIQGS